jgi:hypothetical protein
VTGVRQTFLRLVSDVLKVFFLNYELTYAAPDTSTDTGARASVRLCVGLINIEDFFENLNADSKNIETAEILIHAATEKCC